MQTVGERYELGELLGEGATSKVYRARDLSLDVARAVKVLTAVPEPTRSRLRTRLQAEARVMAGLDHPNVLQIFDIGSEGDMDWVVMELAEGGSLQDRLDQIGPLPAEVGCSYLLQVLSALGAAHEAGVVHRDVKPQNILLNRAGTAMLGDFGIALLNGVERQTRTGAAMGSLPYMAPEQRLDARRVGPSADIYAAGATLYHLLTANNPVDLYASPPHSPRWDGLAPNIRAIIQRATRYEQSRRYPHVQAMARELVLALRELHEQIPAPATVSLGAGALAIGDPGPEPSGELPVRWLRRSSAGWAASTAAAVERLFELEEPEVTSPLPMLMRTTHHSEPPDTSVIDRPRPTKAAAPPPSRDDFGSMDIEPETESADTPPAGRRTLTRSLVGAGVVTLLMMSFWFAYNAFGASTDDAPSTLQASGLDEAVDGPVGMANGEWTGQLGGITATLSLHGGDTQLEGALTLLFGDIPQTSPISGAYDPHTRELKLIRQDEDSDAQIQATLSPDGSRIDGAWQESQNSTPANIHFQRSDL
ncbi:MAG: serine/threonine-protein kinase [Myxococcota bacterium]